MNIEIEETGWIQWGGGKCPLTPETRIDVRWNNGARSSNIQAGTLGPSEHSADDLWAGPQRGGYVVAYRLAAVREVSVVAEEVEIHVRMVHDKEARRWYVSSSNIPGLSLEDETPELLLHRIASCAFDLVELNRAAATR